MRTPLFPYHQNHARLTTFHDWEMPLVYSSILDEHAMVRRRVGLFDVSHMGKLLLAVDVEDLQRFVPSRLPRAEDRCRYTHLLDEEGRIIDDVIITRLASDSYLTVCNAGARDRVVERFRAWLGAGVCTDRTEEIVCLALQGPKASEALQPLVDADLAALRPFRGSVVHASAVPVETKGWARLAELVGPDEADPGAMYLTRTGYTGEDGFEIFAGNDLGAHLWHGLLEETPAGPAGLGARDTLRLEQGYLLSGQDFDGSQTPLEVGYERIIHWEHEFLGREALVRQKKEGGYAQLRGLRLQEPGVPRPGQGVWHEGSRVGQVTSGTHSPSLQTGIALAYLPLEAGIPGTAVQVDLRGRKAAAEVVETPFL